MAIKIALAGNPNCGKTTLFNALTGSNQFVGNWPGVTVEKKEGKLKKAYSGKEETRQFLENLGFVTGGMVTVISQMGGNLIVNIKESRVAIGKDMANKIMV